MEITIDQAKKMFPFLGNVTVVAVGQFDPEIGDNGGQTMVVEGCMNRVDGAEKSMKGK
jgi:DNA/RNA endonuclease YhcR with UshA esterase domain